MREIKSVLGLALRQVRLIGFADDLAARVDRIRTHRVRRQFQCNNPRFVLPPSLLAYGAFGSSDPVGYQLSGVAHARYIVALIRCYHPNPRMICEWGCGPMRVLRHMVDDFDPARLMGLDYNTDTIDWCRRFFPEIQFRINNMNPPLPVADGEVDVVCGISVLTHLSERNHFSYASDLMRCIEPGGLLIITTHGDRYAHKMSSAERAKYEAGELVTRSKIKEGKRMFTAFHPVTFVRKLFRDFEILKHDTSDRVSQFWQDTWIMRRPS
jgi:SAM-dependent methyltransferase